MKRIALIAAVCLFTFAAAVPEVDAGPLRRLFGGRRNSCSNSARWGNRVSCASGSCSIVQATTKSPAQTSIAQKEMPRSAQK